MSPLWERILEHSYKFALKTLLCSSALFVETFRVSGKFSIAENQNNAPVGVPRPTVVDQPSKIVFRRNQNMNFRKVADIDVRGKAKPSYGGSNFIKCKFVRKGGRLIGSESKPTIYRGGLFFRKIDRTKSIGVQL